MGGDDEEKKSEEIQMQNLEGKPLNSSITN